jgi:methylated-DNA-[protein]-cysteine S-methyltransferase
MRFNDSSKIISMDICHIKTPLGTATITGDHHGITSISISDEAVITSQKTPENLQTAFTQLQEYFDGTRTDFSLKINPKGTDFQQKVWIELCKIPFGQYCSYLELSKKLGDAKAIRAVANANGKNPLWIIVPCHRVIGADGSLTGYAGGLWRKKWLLDHENPIKQTILF